MVDPRDLVPKSTTGGSKARISGQLRDQGLQTPRKTDREEMEKSHLTRTVEVLGRHHTRGNEGDCLSRDESDRP